MEERVTIKQLIIMYSLDNSTTYYKNVYKFIDKYTQIEFDSDFYSDYDELDETEKKTFDKMLLMEYINSTDWGNNPLFPNTVKRINQLSLLRKRIEELSEISFGPHVFK